MKKQKLFLVVAVTAVIGGSFFYACKKESNEILPENEKVSKVYSLHSIRNEGNILCFESFEHVKWTIDELDRLLDEYNERYIAPLLAGRSDDELVEIAEQGGIDSYKPFEEFERSLNFTSLRKVLLEAELHWLETTDGENIEEDPDNHYVMETSFRTVLNPNAELKIGGVYFRYLEEGYFETMDITTLTNTRNGDYSNVENGNLVLEKYQKSGCRSGKTKSDFAYNNGKSRRIKWVIAHKTPFPKGRHVKAKTKNYYKKNRTWKKYEATCSAKVYGHISGWDGNCSTQVDFNPNNQIVRHTAAKKAKHKIYVQTMTKSGWVKGEHMGAGGITYSSTLTF
jgi:hypothetical protein